MKQTKRSSHNRKSLQALWQQHVDAAKNATTVNLNESLSDQKKRITRLEADPEEWFKYYFRKFASAEPAPFHLAATKRVISNPEHYEVRMWSRELAKSTRTMMETLYLCLVGHPMPNKTRLRKRYTILISNNESNAVRLLMPYRAQLEFNQAIIHDYGDQVKIGSWEAAEFTTRKGAAFRALGAGQSPRGARNDEVRPDILLFDDIDTDQDCLNPEMIKKKWKWIEEAAIGTRSISAPTTIIFCGNRIATDCCVERATKYADYTHIVNIRDKHGKSTWAAKNTEAHIDRVLKQKSYSGAQKEYFNNPINEGSVFKKMHYKPARPLREYSMLVCYTDPSYKDTSDYKATVLIGKYKEEFHVIKAYLEQTTTAMLVEWHYAIMELTAGCAVYYYMEEVFIQDIIKKDIIDAGKQRGKPIPLQGDTRAKPDKYSRIESLLEPLNRNGQLYLNEKEKDNPGMQMLEQQFTAFAPGSRAHDDGPDAVEGGVYIIINKFIARKAGITCIPRAPNAKRY